MKLYTKKDLRKALDSVFDQYHRSAINRPALVQSMLASTFLRKRGRPAKPSWYAQATAEVEDYLTLKVRDKYLHLSKGKGAGFRRISDWSPKEWEEMTSDRELLAKGNEIKQWVIRGLERQIETVRMTPARNFLL